MALPESTAFERKNQALWFGLTGGALGAAFLMAGLGGPFDGPVLCPLRRFTGIPCPLCGMTHSFVLTAGGHLRDAFAAHPLGPVVFGAFAVAALVLAVLLIRGQRLRLPSPGQWRWAGLAPAAAVWAYQIHNIGPF